MASICNDERVTLGVMSGHGRNTLRLSVVEVASVCRQRRRPGLTKLKAGNAAGTVPGCSTCVLILRKAGKGPTD
jgi:hypothetical protein